MASEAQQIHLVLLQQALIRRAVRRVTSDATLEQCLVMVNERPLFFGVAVKTDRVAGCVSPQLLRLEASMWIVAIVALHQSFIYTMVERPPELYPHILVAAVAQLRRLLFHQELAFLGLVWRMAINARDPVGQVH